MLFFFDTEYAYILAEATQTLSLQDDRAHDENDALWLGTTIIPRGLSVCEHTVNIPAANKGSNRGEATASDIHIINDLKDDVRFCDRPFVLDGPKLRFYAGVPIKTPGGYNIGAFCALDDKPRAGLTDNEFDFMRQMSQNVIDHLENVRTSAEYGRGSRMLTSLGTFFRTAPIIGKHQRRSSDHGGRLRTSQGVDEQRRISSSERGGLTEAPAPQQSTAPREMLHSAAVEVKDYADASEIGSVSNAPQSVASNTSAVARGPSELEDDLQEALEDSIASTFDTAAELMRSAADASSVLFLDVKNQSIEARVRRRTRKRAGSQSNRGNDTDGTSTDASYSTESEDSSRSRLHNRCRVLGQSRPSKESSQPSHTSYFPLKVIRFLLKRYGRGKVWNFNSEGVAASQDSASDGTEISDASVNDVPSTQPQTRVTNRRLRLSQETKHIQQLFPGVRALCFVPLWDQSKERVYAVAIMSTYSQHRVLTNDGELSFMRAFCDVVMASIGRLESSIGEQAKTQFISSLSHELRSPLHGILGGIDFLNGQEFSNGQERPDKMILSQIDNCATTLIEIIEHLLEFAKINNLTKQHTLLPGHDNLASNGHITEDHQTGILLAKLTEDVADATFYSHACAVQNQSGSVAYIYESNLNSSCRSLISLGAWKRLCMNIINNALKYTNEGYIRVSLSQVTGEDDRATAQLVVEDTGIGMSRDFLEDGLFRAFRQENSLNPGTGLGMSLVAKLVKSIGGEIEVRSKKRAGTTVKITVPLIGSSKTQAPKKVPLQGLKLDFEDTANSTLSSLGSRTRRLQIAAVKNNCCMLGGIFDTHASACRVVLESDLASMQPVSKRSLSERAKSLLLLCDDTKSALRLAEDADLQSSGIQLVCIVQPYGPEKILQALHPLLEGPSTDFQYKSPAERDVRVVDRVAEKGAIELPILSRSPAISPPAKDGSLFRTEQSADRKSQSKITSTSQPGVIDANNRQKLSLLLVDDNVSCSKHN